MELDFLFFKALPALNYFFRINYIPNLDDFRELTPKEYERYYESDTFKESNYTHNDKMMALIPQDPEIFQKIMEAEGRNLIVINKDEIQAFVVASKFIDKFIEDSNEEIISTSDKLIYLAKWLPESITKDTPYAKYAKQNSL